MTSRSAQRWHGLNAVVALVALLLQLGLVLHGGRVLDEVEPPGLGVRLLRLVAYFTIQSNLLVAVVTTQLARDPSRDGPVFRAVRLAAVVGIAVTGVVHFVLLRPLLDLDGADRVADAMLHMAVPLLALVGWALFGPRPRVDARSFWWAVAWPVAWLVVTLGDGVVSGWFPYPFLDVDAKGWPQVLVTSAVMTAFFLVVFALARLVDHRARPAPGDVGALSRRYSRAMTRPEIDPDVPPSGTGCAECDAAGGWWVHLRRCAQCGHVGCCDSSPAQHATAHFRETGHPVIQSFEPGEDWFWDYSSDSVVDGPELVAPTAHPRDQTVPGPADRLPEDWQEQVH